MMNKALCFSNERLKISRLIDADMEVISARMNALQTQQQFAIQSLQIANSQPQTLLSLLR